MGNCACQDRETIPCSTTDRELRLKMLIDYLADNNEVLVKKLEK